MLVFDLNCDMGEGIGNDEALMPWISSANIACGFHAGSGSLISETVELAQKHHVKIGAHPSFRDKENFGRKEFFLSSDKIYALVMEQLIRIRKALSGHVNRIRLLRNIARFLRRLQIF